MLEALFWRGRAGWVVRCPVQEVVFALLIGLCGPGGCLTSAWEAFAGDGRVKQGMSRKR